MKVAVIGHVEWVEFARVEALPGPGEIAHASETWAEAAGGGAVAAVQLANLGAETTLFTSLGNDELAARCREELEGRGVRVCAAAPRQPQRRAFTHIDETGERAITVLGDKLRPNGDDESLPWHELKGFEGAFFVSGDVHALRRSRNAAVLVGTSRELGTIRFAGIELDALVGSAVDGGERYDGDLDPPPKLVVATSSHLGGWAQPGGPFEAAEKPGQVQDTYGAGDCFAAGLTFALARGDDPRDALALAARCGATVVTGKGPYGRQLKGGDVV